MDRHVWVMHNSLCTGATTSVQKTAFFRFSKSKKIQNKNFQTFENTYAAQFLKDARVIQPKYQKS